MRKKRKRNIFLTGKKVNYKRKFKHNENVLKLSVGAMFILT